MYAARLAAGFAVVLGVVFALACGLPLEGLEATDASQDADGRLESSTSHDGSGGLDSTQPIDAPDDAFDAGTACDADLSSDPAHCGRCDRDCAGGTCTGGECTPEKIVTGSYPIRAIGITDTYLVWVTNGVLAIHRALIDGGSAQIIENLASSVSELTVAGGKIYYTTISDLHVVALDGGGDTVLHAGGMSACVQVNGLIAYVVNGGSPPRVAMFDLGAQTVSPLVPQQDLIAPWGVAVAGNEVYWSGNQHGVPDGGIWRLALDGGAVAEIVPHLANPNCITVYDDALFWPNSDDGTIMTSDLSGNGVRVLATGQDRVNPPTTVAVDAKFVYWHSGTNIMRLAR